MSRFDTILEDFNSERNDVKLHIQSARRYGGNTSSALSCLKEAADAIVEMENYLRQLEGESRVSAGNDRMHRLAKCQDCRAEISSLRREVDEMRHSNAHTFGQYNTMTDDEGRRQILQEGIGALSRTGDSLARAQVISNETDNIGVQVTQDLSNQRETLENAYNRLDDTQGELSQSRKLIRSLKYGVLKSKIFLIGVIVIEIAIAFLIVYFKFIR